MAGEQYQRKECKLTQAQAEAFDVMPDMPFIDVRGSCPRCGDETRFSYSISGFFGVKKLDDQQEREAFKALTENFGLEPRETEADFTVYCRCEGNHDKRPEDKEGCGAYWQYHVDWE